MRRVPVLALVMLVSLLAIIAASRSAPTQAQDASPAAMMMAHPIVGTWQLDTDTDDPNNPPETAIFFADGGFIEIAIDGAGTGRWENTGPDTVNLNIWFLNSENGNYSGTVHVRVAGTIAADGASFDADYTLEFIMPDGTMSGQYGPGHAHGTRVSVEPMGSPTGPLSDLSSQFEGTPAATPAP